MIFITVGHQMPFDRLVNAVDEWAAQQNGVEVLAQVGAGGKAPRHLPYVRELPPAEFRRTVEQCSCVVSHAGTGSIFAALRAGKPVLVMPRRADLRETRNDHQLATVRRLCPRLGVPAAEDERELTRWLDNLDKLIAAPRIGPDAPEPLAGAIRDFIWSGQADLCTSRSEE